MTSRHRRQVALVILLPLLAGIAGCSEYWTSTVSRTKNMDSGDVMLTTADLRQTTRIRAPGMEVTCAEPSPDVAKIAAASLDASGSGSASSVGGAVSPEVALTLATSRSEALAELGQRLATVQLLRDGMFRACEAYANGAIDRSAYSAILSRYDKLMVTMLLGEFAAADTTRIMPITLTSSGEAHGTANATAGTPAAPAAAPAEGAADAAPASGGTGSSGAVASEAKTETQAAPVVYIQPTPDRAAVAAALASMQQAYIDDLNVDPLIINCLRTDILKTDGLAQICTTLAPAILPQIVNGKIAGTLLRASGTAANGAAMTEKIQEIRQLQAELAKLQAQSSPAAPGAGAPGAVMNP